MSILSILLIAFSLSLDSCAVAVTAGVSNGKIRLHQALKVALIFGLCQMAMPMLGWLAGQGFKNILNQSDHWLAFILLTIIGGKMIYEGLKPKGNTDGGIDVLNNKVLFALGIATSIDALVVGLSLALLKAPLYTTALVIGLVTFLMSFLGVYVGKKCGCLFKNKLELLGGLVLLFLGLKILVSHLYF